MRDFLNFMFLRTDDTIEKCLAVIAWCVTIALVCVSIGEKI